MRAEQVVAGLAGLAGGVWFVHSVGPRGELRAQINVQSVDGLPESERMSSDCGDVILWDGTRSGNGMMNGWTLWARDVVEIQTLDDGGGKVRVKARDGEMRLMRIGIYEGPGKALLIQVGRYKASIAEGGWMDQIEGR